MRAKYNQVHHQKEVHLKVNTSVTSVQYIYLGEIKVLRNLKGALISSGRVTHLKRMFTKTCCFFLFSTYVGHGSLSCGTLICLLLSVGNSFKTYIIYVDLRKLGNAFSFSTDTFQLNRVAKLKEDKIRYHKISFNTLNTLGTRRGFRTFLFKCVTRPDLSVVPLTSVLLNQLSFK